MTGSAETIEKSARNTLAAVIVILCCAAATGGQPAALPGIVKENLNKKFTTAADAVILQEKRTLTLQDDGKVREQVRIVQKILTDHGADAFCDPRIRFNDASQRLNIIEASTYMLDGKKVDTLDNGKNQSTPNSIAPFPWYTDVQEMIVTHVGVELEGITVLEYEIKDLKSWRRFFYGTETFVDERDIAEKILEIRVPAGKELAWEAYNFQPGTGKTKSGDHDVYTFSVKSVAGANLHESSPAPSLTLPTLHFSETIDGKTLAAVLLGESKDGVKISGGEDVPDGKKILDVIDLEIKDELLSPLDRTLYIYKRIIDELGDPHVDRKEFGWAVRSPFEAFSSGYADGLEKFRILQSVFGELGFSPVPVVTLYRTDGKAVHHPDNLAAAWVRISAHGFYLYLPAAGNAAGGEPRPEKAFLPSDTGLTPAAFVKPATARARIDVSMDLKKDPHTFAATIKLRGKHNPYWNVFLSGGSVEAKSIAAGLLKGAPVVIEKASFQRLALDESVLTVKGTVEPQGGVVDITLGAPLLDAAYPSLELWRQERETPLLVKEKEIESVSLKVLVPEGAEIEYVPVYKKKKMGMKFASFPGSSEDGSLEVTRGAKAGDGEVIVSRKVILTPGVVAPGAYGALKETLSEAYSPNGSRVIIRIPEKP
ncbi:MAG: DUF3857 domain-containing protein [Pseudomonadota bacterium]